METLTYLRKLAEYRQFTELEPLVQKYRAQTSDPAALPLLFLALAELGARGPAEAVLKTISPHQAGLDADALVDLGGGLIVLQRFEEAVPVLEQALGQRSGHALGLARLGYCRMALGELDLAGHLFERAAGLAPLRIPVLNNLARVHLLREDPEAAWKVLDRVWTLWPEIKKSVPRFIKAQYLHILELLQLEIWVAKEEFGAAEAWLETRSGRDGEITGWVKQYACFLAENNHHSQAEEVLRTYLGRDPDNIGLHMQLAELAQVQGRFIQAVSLLRRALKKDDKNIGLWVQLSQACLNRFDNQARKAAEKAVDLADALTETDERPFQSIRKIRAKAQNALAMVENSGQNYNAAERLFLEILEDFPDFVPALQGLGQQRMQQGDIDAAVALFERVRQIDPVKGQAMLMNARRFPGDTATLAHMERAAEIPSLEGRVRSGFLFHLASAWEKRGEYDKAMGFAHRANEAARRFLPYDPGAHRNRCARIRYAFSKSLYEHRKGCGHDSCLPVYVLGMPRSGTTLVEQIIAGHSRIFGAGELGTIPSRIQGLNRWERHVGSGRRYPDCIDDLNPYITRGIADGILEELRELAAGGDKPDARHVVDKLPHNFENVGFIKFLFPNARIISVRRDPRDIALSNYFTDYQAKHGGMGFAYDLTNIGRQLADHNLLMYHWQQLFPGEILEVKYEAVVDDLEGEARRMLDYLGVAWEPQVLRFNELERPVKTASVWQVRQPIYKTSKARWKNYQACLAPLIRGTNAPVEWDPVTDMITLPEPAFLQEGISFYKKGKLKDAELCFKKMLHFNPGHAACNYMVGLIYCSIGKIIAAIPHMEKALEKCPWKKEWRENLLKACELTGDVDKYNALKEQGDGRKGLAVSPGQLPVATSTPTVTDTAWYSN